MNHFSRDRNFKPRRSSVRPGGGGFGRSEFGGGRGSGGSQMHSATCGNCGRHCEVPFKPTGSRPVLCSDCFQESKGGRSFGSSRGSGGRGRQGRMSNDRSMHQAFCHDCGDLCEVPFKPTGNKPIYCSHCFQDHRESLSEDFSGAPKGRGFNDRPSGKPHFEDRKMHSAICASCGNKCEIPFLPKGGRPVYCDACFGKEAGIESDRVDALKEQFDVLNQKLDKIIKLLLPVVSAESVDAKIEEGVEQIKEEVEKASASAKASSSAKATDDKTADKKKVAKKKKSTKKVMKKKAATKKAKKSTAKTKQEKKSVAKKEVKKKAVTKKVAPKKKVTIKKKATTKANKE